MNKVTIRKMALAIGLTFVAIGVWAQDAMLSDSIADKVTLRDGTMVKAQRLPQRAPKDDYVYTYKGVKYTYITENNYTRYFNTSVHKPSDYGWYLDSNGWYVNAERDYITAASIDADNFPSSGEVYIINDLVGLFTGHTHLGCIADNAFWGMPGVRRIYFQDCDALNYSANTDFYFFIGDKAFANCENLEEVNMMQWTTSGSNQWQALPPTAVKRLWGSMLDNSPKAWIRVGTSVYQQYLSSQTWGQVRDRITTFEHSSDDITEDGGVYSFMKAEDGSALSNEDWNAMLQQIGSWKDHYEGLNPEDLLYKNESDFGGKLWYVRLTGVNDKDIIAKNGVLTVYNDVGTTYDYKTIAIGGKLSGNQNIKKVRFESSPSNVGNANTPLKLVVEDGAFSGCSNLEEFRLYYYNNEGTNKEQVLGPTDVIPGKNVFDGCNKLRIIVAASRYWEFLGDPNWKQYASMIVPDELQTDDFEEDGAVYGYLRRDNGQYYSNAYNEELALMLRRWADDANNFKVTDVLAPDKGVLGTEVWYVKLNKVDDSKLEKQNGVLTVYNDVGTSYDYKTIAIDSMALRGNKTVKKVRFESSPSNIGNANLPMRLFLQPGAFRGCSNLEEVQVLYYNNRGTNKWESLGPKDIIPGKGAFDDCPNLRILVAKNRLQEFMDDPNWAPYVDKIGLADFEPDGIDDGVTELNGEGIEEGGLIYDYYASESDGSLMTNAKIDQMVEGLKSWKDNYEGIDVRSLLEPSKQTLGSTVWYLRVRGADSEAIRKQNGVVTMYNDVGTVYNYKTICLKSGVLSDNSDLRTFRLESSASNVGNANVLMGFVIEDGAFRGCSNLELVDLLYFNNRGTNKEQALGPKDVYVGKNVFDGCPKVRIRVAASRYEEFLADPNWKVYSQLLQPDEPASKTIVEELVKYNYFVKDDGSLYTNDDNLVFAERQKAWNAQYMNFAVNDVLADDYSNIMPKVYYMRVTGFDDAGASSFDGNLHINNDVGTVYNYKTIQVVADAFKGNNKIKSVTFHSSPSYVGNARCPMGLVLGDSAFAHCPNLKEVALYYYNYESSNRMEFLLPTDIVPGKGCFDGCDPELKIMVAPEVYDFFINDPNWARYKDHIVASQFLPTTFGPFKVDGVTYDFASRTLNSLPTSELVQREMSLFTILTAAAQVALLVATAGGSSAAAQGASVAPTAAEVSANAGVISLENGIAVTSEAAAKLVPEKTIQVMGEGLMMQTAHNEFMFLEPQLMEFAVNGLGKHMAHNSFEFLINSIGGAFKNLISILPRYVMSNVPIYDTYFNTLYTMACYGPALVTTPAISTGMTNGIQAMANAMQKRKSSWNLGPMLTVFRDNKHTIYHVYIKDVDNTPEVKIYNDPGSVYNYKTVMIGDGAFRGKNAVRKVSFYDVNGLMTGRMYAPLAIVVPDKCFDGCSALRELDLMLNVEDGSNHRRSLGPENFVLNGADIFAGCDTTQLKIRVGKSRLQDFVDDPMWGKYRSMFVVEDDALPVSHTKAGVQYANLFELNSRRVDESYGEHTIDHLTAVGIEKGGLGKDGEMRLYNDIGTFNNYHLDNVNFNAFRGNSELRGLTFWDLDGVLWTGDAYDDLDLMLNDSCLADCPNLEHIDMVYLRTDGSNKAEHWGPDKIKLGRGVFAGSPNVKIRMDYYKQHDFLSDEKWVQWKDHFQPCLIGTENQGVYDALKKWVYRANGTTFSQYVDLSRITPEEMAELSFRNSNITSFDEFEAFGSVGLKEIRVLMFADSRQLQCIKLPDSIASIGAYAFSGCSQLKRITINRPQPPTLGNDAFNGLPDDFIISVPDSLVETYRAAWPQYANHIGMVSPTRKVVRLTQPGTLAEALGLKVVSEGGPASSFKMEGTYAHIDSLKIYGPINGLDVAVLRTLAGRQVDDCSFNPLGHLKYLNLYNADIVYDKKEVCYNRKGSNDYIQANDRVDTYMFWKCDALRTLILPKSAKVIAHDAFSTCSNLETLVIGDNTETIEKNVIENCLSMGQIVMLCKAKPKTHENAFRNGVPVGSFVVPKTLRNAYSGDDHFNTRAAGMLVLFEDEAVQRAMAAADVYTMLDLMVLGSVEGIVEGNTDVTTLRETMLIVGAETLGDHSFAGMSQLREAGIPFGCTAITQNAFKGCSSLLNVYSGNPEPPTLAADAFEDLPENFVVFVVDSLVSRYRAAWPQYKEHIGAYNPQQNDIFEVTVTEPNTLDKALGLNVTMKDNRYIKSVEGNFWDYSALKINGPIGGKDVALLRVMAGRTIEDGTAIPMASLRYLDLYDARIVADRIYYNTKNVNDYLMEDNALGTNMFWQCDVLETLILPRTATKMADEACYDMANLETLVVGDMMDYIDDDALGDLPSLENLAFLGQQVPNFHSDAFTDPTLSTNTAHQIPHIYVPAGAYNKYTNSTILIKHSQEIKASFDDDALFSVLARHSVFTPEQMSNIDNIDGWFSGNSEVANLEPLSRSRVNTIADGQFSNMQALQRIKLPATLESIGKQLLSGTPSLRYVDLRDCSSLELEQADARDDMGLAQEVLVYMPVSTNVGNGLNLVWSLPDGTATCSEYMLDDAKDYLVPVAFDAATAQTNRIVEKSEQPYTVCLPFDMLVPNGIKAYQLSGRNDGELVFAQVLGTMKAFEPYLIIVETDGVTLSSGTTVTIPVSDGSAYGHQQDAVGYSFRGSLKQIENSRANELGAYVMNDDSMWHPVLSDTDAHKAVTIPPFRCYLLQSRSNGARGAIGMTLEDASGVEQLRTIDSDGTERVYDLSGRRVDGNTKGHRAAATMTKTIRSPK